MKTVSKKNLAIHGGEKVCPVTWPSWPQHGPDEERRLLQVLRTGEWWFGENVRRFEEEFAAWHGGRHVVTCTNGTTAIEAALRACGVGRDDEVIVPAYTFIATASAVVSVGAVPVFADIDAETLCIDPDDVARRVTPKTRAVIAVHVAGRIANMARVTAIAEKHHLIVLEDAAHAWGSRRAGRAAGTFGACGTFSFQVSKNITCGEGGAIVTDDDSIAELCRSSVNCGRTPDGAWYDHANLGSNQRLTEFQAAVLLAQLARADEQLARRDRNALVLDERLKEIDGLRVTPSDQTMDRRSRHFYTFRLDTDAVGASRDAIVEAIQAEGVPVSPGWYRPLHDNAVFGNASSGAYHPVTNPLAGRGLDYARVNVPVCAQVCADIVWIPQHVLLAEEREIALVADAIEKVVRRAAEVT